MHINEAFSVTAPLALNLGSRWRWVANLSLRQRKPLERIPVPFSGRLGGSRAGLDVVEKWKKLLPLLEFVPRTIQLAAESLKPLRYLVWAPTYSGGSGLKYRPGERANLSFIVVSFHISVVANASNSWQNFQVSSEAYAFCFNRLCNPCGFWPAQLSLSILSRKVFTECRCQRHIKPPTFRTSD